MIRYAFLSQLDPPAPFVKIIVSNPATGATLRDVPAQLDTAADRSVLPDALVKSLSLPQVGTIELGGFGGAIYHLPLYLAQLGLHDLPPRRYHLAAHPDESWVLLGRDILNSYRLVIDGPQLTLEIG